MEEERPDLDHCSPYGYQGFRGVGTPECLIVFGRLLEARHPDRRERHNHDKVVPIPAQDTGLANPANLFHQAEDVGHIIDVDRFGLLCHTSPSF